MACNQSWLQSALTDGLGHIHHLHEMEGATTSGASCVYFCLYASRSCCLVDFPESMITGTNSVFLYVSKMLSLFIS